MNSRGEVTEDRDKEIFFVDWDLELAASQRGEMLLRKRGEASLRGLLSLIHTWHYVKK